MGAFVQRYLFVIDIHRFLSYLVRMKIFSGVLLLCLFSIAFSFVQGTLDSCPMQNIDYYGTELHWIDNVSSWGTCGYFCYITPDCHYWSWHTGGDNDCFLKSTRGNIYNIDGVISGDRNCFNQVQP